MAHVSVAFRVTSSPLIAMKAFGHHDKWTTDFWVTEKFSFSFVRQEHLTLYDNLDE
jgi:hypothetical protein